MRAALALFFTATILAGCSSSSGGDHQASLTFNGSGGGSHNDVANCGSTGGSLIATGQVEEGRVELRAYDGDGEQVFSQDFTGGVNVASQRVYGDAGAWRITAARSDGLLGSEFRGHYDVQLAC